MITKHPPTLLERGDGRFGDLEIVSGLTLLTFPFWQRCNRKTKIANIDSWVDSMSDSTRHQVTALRQGFCQRLMMLIPCGEGHSMPNLSEVTNGDGDDDNETVCFASEANRCLQLAQRRLAA